MSTMSVVLSISPLGTKMTSKILRISSLVLLALSTCLSVTVLATAVDVLRIFNEEKNVNPWWLPVWPQHFDTKGLETLVGVSTAVTLCNAAAGTSMFKTVSLLLFAITRMTSDSVQRSASRIASALVLTLLTVLSLSLAFFASLVGVIYPAVLDHQSPGTDTMQTWTCRWDAASSAITALSNGVPTNFGKLCRESVRYAYHMQDVIRS